MNTVLHLARKDLTRHRIPALFVLAAILIEVLDTRFGFAALSVRSFPDGFLGSMIKWPLCYLFVVAVVQEDSVVDPRAHWLTRPIAPLQLLAAKLLVNAVVVVGPLALAQMFLAHWAAAAPAMSLAIGTEVLAGASVIMLATMLVASLTRTILESCVVVGSLLLLWALVALLTYGRSLNPAWWPRASDIDGGSRFIVIVATAIPAVLAVLAHHYRRRSLAFTITAGLIAATAITLLAHQFPWRLLPPAKPHTSEIARVSTEAPALQLSFALAGPTIPNGFDFTYDRTARISVQHRRVAVGISCEKNRSDRLITGMNSTTTLYFADGTSKTYPKVWTYWDGLDLAPALRAALGQTDPAKPEKFRRPLNLLVLAPGDNPMPPERPVRATTIVRYHESRLEPFFRQAATQRASFTSGSTYQASAAAPAPDGDGFVINLRRFNSTSLIMPERPAALPDPRLFAGVLQHSGRNEHAIGTLRRFNPDSGIGNVHSQRFSFTFSEVRSSDGRALGALSDEWLAGAELVLYKTSVIGEHEQKLEFENLFFALDSRGELQMR